MMMMPFQVLGIWLRGLLSVAVLGAGLGLLGYWWTHRRTVEVVPAGPRAEVEDDARRREGAGREDVARVWHFGANRETAALLGGLALTLWSFLGGSLGVPRMLRATAPDDPRPSRDGEVRRLRRPDGTELQVELYGPADAPPIVLTHGWGADSTEWEYAKRELAGRFRLIVWDLPGLGRSSQAADDDYSLERMARDLDAVRDLAGDRPAVLLGHSIGGMILLTYARLFPEALGPRVAGLVLAHTTYTNPVRTTSMSGLYTALQKPVLEPLCHLMIALYPLVWAMNWLAYLNGSLHRSTEQSGFSGRETRGELDLIARLQPRAHPGVVAKGMLAMFRYDATATLGAVGVPTLVVSGDRDTTTRPHASLTMAEAIPRATLASLEPARHMGLVEHHGRFAELVTQFAGSLATPAVA